jgi:hypothetical protein
MLNRHYLRNLVADGLLLVVIVLLVEQRRVEGSSRVVHGSNGGGHVGLVGHGQVHGVLPERKNNFLNFTG